MYTNQMLALGEEVIHVERAVQNTRGGRKRRRFLRPKHAGRDIPEEGHAKDTEGNLFESIGSRSGRSSSSSGGGGVDNASTRGCHHRQICLDQSSQREQLYL